MRIRSNRPFQSTRMVARALRVEWPTLSRSFHCPLSRDQMPEEPGTRDVLQHLDAHPNALEQTTIGLRGEIAGLRSEMNSRFDRVY